MKIINKIIKKTNFFLKQIQKVKEEVQSMCTKTVLYFIKDFLPSCHPPSPGGDSRLGKCLSPCLSCPSSPGTGWSHLGEPDAGRTSLGPPHRSETLTEMVQSENDFTADHFPICDKSKCTKTKTSGLTLSIDSLLEDEPSL